MVAIAVSVAIDVLMELVLLPYLIWSGRTYLEPCRARFGVRGADSWVGVEWLPGWGAERGGLFAPGRGRWCGGCGGRWCWTSVLTGEARIRTQPGRAVRVWHIVNGMGQEGMPYHPRTTSRARGLDIPKPEAGSPDQTRLTHRGARGRIGSIALRSGVAGSGLYSRPVHAAGE